MEPKKKVFGRIVMGFFSLVLVGCIVLIGYNIYQDAHSPVTTSAQSTHQVQMVVLTIAADSKPLLCSAKGVNCDQSIVNVFSNQAGTGFLDAALSKNFGAEINYLADQSMTQSTLDKELDSPFLRDRLGVSTFAERVSRVSVQYLQQEGPFVRVICLYATFDGHKVWADFQVGKYTDGTLKVTQIYTTTNSPEYHPIPVTSPKKK